MALGEGYSRLKTIIKRFEAPVISVALDQVYTAIRILRPEADVHIAIDETLAAGYSGWMELPLPVGIICCQRYGLEWGEEPVKLGWSIDDISHIACQPHNVTPIPTLFEYARYWVKRDRLFLYRENTDGANPRAYHLSVLAVMPAAADWDRWWPKIEKFAKEVLE